MLSPGRNVEAGAEHAHGLLLLAEQVHLDAVPLAVVDRAMGEGGEVEIAAELAVDADQHVEIEARGDAGRIIVGVVKHALVLFEIGADDHLRALAQDIAGAAQEGAGLMRLEIADGRARKEADLRHARDLRRQREWRGEVGGNGIDGKIGEIPAQAVGLRIEEFAGYIDGDVGRERALLQQQADLGGCARAEFDQRRAVGDDRGDLGAAIAQDAELGPGRIIFRQLGDGLEQLRAGRIVEIFRRQALGMLRQVADGIARESRGLLVRKMRIGQSGSMHVHVTLLNALSGALLIRE